MTARSGRRVTLRAVDAAQARRILDHAPGSGDTWAADYPFEGDLAALTMFLRGIERDGDPGPFGYYQIVRDSDGVVVGGIGFKGRPDGGVVEIGYGLAPSCRGDGLAAEAVRCVVDLAVEAEVTRLVAEVEPDNVASLRTLEHAGFHRSRTDTDLCHYRLDLSPEPSGTA